ncbi:GDSL esterase/lipase At1g58525-like [Capsicum annuum]|uniref:GDSL esterase/lipase At1g58525-like n=1 Tax=Capsicum annuum TaxID=4072 RepID=UPI001FB11D5F|nr:GDSL esterase/lipase At1g58525-like [Capsicum annuum]
MKMKLFFYIFVLLSAFIIGRGAMADHEQPHNVNGIFPAVFVFGDSLVDTGNNNWFPTLAKGNMPQHGKNFEGGKATGRFCDGKIPSDILVEELGIKELLPPYLDPTLEAKDLITGVSFASAASGYDPQTGAFLVYLYIFHFPILYRVRSLSPSRCCPIGSGLIFYIYTLYKMFFIIDHYYFVMKMQPVLPLQKQLELFKEYIGKIKGIAGETRALEIVKESLYVVATGNNDIQLNPSSSLNPSYIDIMLNFASTFLQVIISIHMHPTTFNSLYIVESTAGSYCFDLNKLGARKIGVAGVLAMGCLPVIRNTLGGIERNCVDSVNEKVYMFNNKLSTEINSLSNKFPDAKMVYIDVYNIMLDLLNNPTKYGYKITKNGCCAFLGRVDLLAYCPIACSNDYDYLFWDGYHFTERNYRIVVKQILQQHLQTFISSPNSP